MQVVRALVEGSPQQGVSTPAQTSVGGTAGIILVFNAKRKGFIVQNTGTTTLYLSFGATLPTTSVYHVALKAATGADDGSGATYFDDSWVGVVNAISSAPGGTCVVTETVSSGPNWDLASDWGLYSTGTSE